MRKIIWVGFVAGVAVLWSGCETCKPGKPGPIGKYNIGITLDQSLKDSQDMLVDLIGVNPASRPSWEAYDMGSYWKPGDPKRRDALDKVTFDLGAGKTLTNTLSLSDPHWSNWLARGSSHVMVLANTPVPASEGSKPGNQDRRRQILPLDRCHWPKGTTTLNLLVQQSGIEILTPPRPTK